MTTTQRTKKPKWLKRWRRLVKQESVGVLSKKELAELDKLDERMKRFMANPNKCLVTKHRKRKGKSK
jgi:hypothetical protein